MDSSPTVSRRRNRVTVSRVKCRHVREHVSAGRCRPTARSEYVFSRFPPIRDNRSRAICVLRGTNILY